MLTMLLLLFAVCSASPVSLIENTALYHEKLSHGESRQYLLTNLTPGELYEFKVSYPATQPFTFTISFSDSLEAIPQRKLLDIEKEEFVPRGKSIYVTVTAHDYRRAVKHAPHVSYSAYYERVHGGVPAQAYRLIAYLCLLVPCSMFISQWVFKNWYDVIHEHES